MQHLLGCNLSLQNRIGLLCSVWIYFWRALEDFYLSWRLLLNYTWFCNRNLKSNCGWEFRTATAFCNQFELFIDTRSEQIIDVVVAWSHYCMLMMLRVLLTPDRNIASRRHRFKASDSCSSVTDWGQCVTEVVSTTAESCAGWLSLRILHLRLQLSKMRRYLWLKEQFTFFLTHS